MRTKVSKLSFRFLALGIVAMLAANAQAKKLEVYTGDPGGADAELRESQPTTERGTSVELANRIQDGSRNSVFYLRFPGLDGVKSGWLNERIIVELHNRAGSLNDGRINADADPNDDSLNTGNDFYVLDPNSASNATWSEDPNTGINPQVAHVAGDLGYVYDGNFRTKNVLSYADPNGDPDNNTPNSGLTFLGNKQWRGLNPLENNMPVDEEFRLILAPGSPLHNAIVGAQANGDNAVTLVVTPDWEWNTPNGSWPGFNYQFHSHESAEDVGRDVAPSLYFIPEPSSLALFCLGGLAMLRRRR